MATYFHGGPEIQADGLQTLYLMNPRYAAGYAPADTGPSAAATANLAFLHSAGPASSLDQASPSSHGQQQNHHHHFVGIPLQAPAAPELSRQMASIQVVPNNINQAASIQGMIPRLQYNLWNQASAGNGPVSLVSQLGSTPRPSSLDTPQPQKGLSLSLSPQHSNYTGYRLDHGQQEAVPAVMPQNPPTAAGQQELRFTPSSATSPSNGGTAGLQSFVMGSKYLKAAQQLLDEVVSVGTPRGGGKEDTSRASKTAAEKTEREGKAESGSTGEASGKSVVPDLSTAERQELQMKKAKLINMLDEVEQRYRQYHQQMLIVISSFESIAGHGSARTYTSLALRTISKQFRCLRDAITGQIRAAGKSLGEEDYMAGSKSEGGSRLRFVDHQIRQQRALQQLGMMQHNAWRPQRGLPERSVSVLRAWLFEHFLHPYPKDSDKLMLAKQTGLTRNQVSNWFINARVRLWKPMVEEMYQEETKSLEHQNNPEDSGNANKKVEQVSTPNSTSSPSRTEQSDSIISRAFNQQHNHDQQNPQFAIPPQSPPRNLRMPLAQYEEAEAEGLIQSNIKKARTNEAPVLNPMTFSMMHQDLKPEEPTNQDMYMKFGDIMQAGDDHGFNQLITGHAADFGGYTFGNIGRFDAAQFAPRFPGNGVSLTLGLQHCDQSLQQPGAAQPSYLSNGSIAMGRRLEVGNDNNNGYCNLNDNSNGNNHNAVVATNAYDNHSIQNRKGFAAQLLPDFVS